MAELPDMSRLGSTGLQSYGGRIYDEWLPTLQGPQGRRVYREMADNHPVVGSILFAIEMLIRRLDWKIIPGGQDAQSEEIAAFVEQCLHDMEETWADTLSEILTFLVYGWSYLEVVYKRRQGADDNRYTDGRIGWAGWQVRGQETLNRWEFLPGGKLAGMHQLGPPDWVPHFIPLSKALLFRPKVNRGNPEGRSILRNAYRPYYFGKHIEVIEGIGIERDLAGLPVAKVPPELLAPDATPAQAQLLSIIKEIVTGIKRDENEGVIWPLSYTEDGKEEFVLELLSTGGQRQFDTDAIIGRYNQQIAMTVLADFIMLGHEQVGSQALGGSKIDLFLTAMSGWLGAICDQVNDRAIPALLRYNGLVTDTPPTLGYGTLANADLGVLGLYLFNLSQAGFQLDTAAGSALSNTLLKAGNLPEVTPEDAARLQAEKEAEQQRQMEQQQQAAPKPAPTKGDG